MKMRKRQAGFTLVEILVVVVIIMILTVGMITVGRNVRKDMRIKSTQGTIGILCSALEEYKNIKDTSGRFMFPRQSDPDNGIGDLDAVFWGAELNIGIIDADMNRGDHFSFGWGDDVDVIDMRVALANVEFMYFFLDDEGACRVVLDKLPENVKANDDNDLIDYAGQIKPLIEVNDAWGHPIDYRWQGVGSFPLLVSAGPDGLFDTGDDVISSQF